MGVDDLPGFRIGIGHRFGGDCLLEPAIEAPEQDAGTANRLQRVPRHDQLGGRIGAELQVQSGHHGCRHRIGRTALGGCGRRRLRPDQRCRRCGRPADAGGGEQLATAELEVEWRIRCGHGGCSTVAGVAVYQKRTDAM